MALIKNDVPSSFERDLSRMRNRLQRCFEEPFGFELPLPMIGEKRIDHIVWSPAVEATESPAEYLVTAELPGIAPEQVEVQISDGMLTLRGTKSEEKQEEDQERTWHLWERSYGEFQRTFRFPLPVQEGKVSAEFSEGILKVRVPKREVTPPTARKVPIAKR